ncbi:hypothetical protein IKQ19_15660 [Candidatus Saccharibacteria bacterium]|nr:hypothetical protein [Candidatus Saccharibacteria bacterium]
MLGFKITKNMKQSYHEIPNSSYGIQKYVICRSDYLFFPIISVTFRDKLLPLLMNGQVMVE